jgi:NAD(P)-dependent dehydrogenase (short-subunit alcohol dehydrogenase family)
MHPEGRCAVVTGGSRGIGRAVAASLVRAGVSVLVVARDGERAAATAAELAGEGGTVHAFAADVSDPEDVERLAAQALEQLGRVDILVNNAGLAHSASLARTTSADWDRVMDVNAKGTFLCTRAFLPGMLDAGFGRVVNVASTAGLDGGPYIAAYAASKHAVIGFTTSVAAETEGTGVTVNAVCPGYVDTDLVRESVERIVAKTGRSEEVAREMLASANASGRLLEPEEIADVVAGLCADGAGSIHGQIIVIDGPEE